MLGSKGLKLMALPLLLFCLLFLGACTPLSPPAVKSPLTVQGTVAQSIPENLIEARIVVSRGKHIIEEIAPLLQNEFQAALSVPIGQWELSVLLIDEEGKVHFQSTPQTIQVDPHRPSRVELVLRPADSQVSICIDLKDYPFRHSALRARIHFDDAIYEVIREHSGEQLQAVLSLEPGSYEFKIELFTDSFRAGDKLGPGVWELIEIPPNENVAITWSPLSTELQIAGRVESLLPAPANLKATKSPEGILISWDPIFDPDLNGYFIFAQTNPLERFEILTPIPIKETSYSYHPEDAAAKICFAAAPVSNSGLVGYYSASYCLNPQ